MTEKISPFSNVFLFYGEDDFSLRRKIDFWKTEFAKKYSASAITVVDAANLSELDLISKLRSELAPSLFSAKKLLIVRNSLPRKASQTDLSEFFLNFISLIPKDYFVIFWETSKPDNRLGFTKKFLSMITATEFNLPHGLELNQWIKAMAKTLGVEISDVAADKLAQFLGRDLFEEKKVAGRVVDRKEAFNLWQVYSELIKLTSNTSQIEANLVASLVKPKVPDSVFALTNEMVAKNQKGAFQALENFLDSQTLDEKSAFIKIIGLLSEQIRSLLVVFLLQKSGQSNELIAEKLGWTSGRVFITSKNLKNISESKLKRLLAELLLIDQRIKSSDANTKLDIDLFLVQATA